MEFADILEGMGRRSPGVDASTGARAASGDFWRVLDGLANGAGVDTGASRAAYRANDAGTATRVEVDAPPSIDPEDIADELDLRGAASLEELKSVRRLFARLNHPDRVPMPERERANIRMTIANALIDEAAARFAR